MDQIRVPQGTTQPPIERQLARADDKPVDLDGKTVQFFMRVFTGSTLKIAAAPATIVDADQGHVRYAPTAGDFGDEGRFVGWFRVLTGGTAPEDFDEFEILVYAHDFGLGARLGPIARAARAEMPVAWDLVSRYEAYGAPELQRKVEVGKLRVLRVSVPVGDEDGLDIRVIDFIGKLVAIDVIEAAIDIWSDHIVSQSTPRGEGEVHTFPDRIAALERKKKRLEQQTREMIVEIEEITGQTLARAGRGPDIDSEEPLITPGLEEFPPPYDRRTCVGSSANS